MPTLSFLDGFEYGAPSGTWTSGGGLFSSVWGTPGTEIAIDAAYARNAGNGLQCAPTASTRGSVRKTIAGTPTGQTMTFYVKIVSAPSAYRSLASFVPAAGSYPNIGVDGSNFIVKQGSNLVGTGPAYSVGTWYRVEWKVDISANPWAIYAKIDGGTEFGGTIAVAASTLSGADLGCLDTSGAAYTAYFDDWMAAALADYPLGAEKIIALWPDGAGTDVNPSYFTGTWDSINDWSTADYISQTTLSTTSYKEVTFQDTTETTIKGVMAYLQYMAAGTQADNGQTRIRSNTTETTVYSGDMSESSAFYKSALVSPDGGAWDQTKVNALLGRVGYSSDVAPVPYWCGLLLQVAVPSANAYTLPCAKGDLTLTGEAMGPLAARLLGAAQGSFSLAGQAINLAHGYSFSLAKGDYALTGETAGLLTARKVALAQGSYGLAGEITNLLMGHRLTAGQGAFTLTGEAAAVLLGHLLGAAYGSFVLSGQNVTLTYTPLGGYTLTCAQGSFAITGEAANLLFGHKLAAAQGSYSLSGIAVTLTYTPLGGYTLSLNAGTFALTGEAAALLLSRLLALGYGAYVLTGEDVALRTGIVITTPPRRTFMPSPDRRSHFHGADGRVQSVGAEDRTQRIAAEDRTQPP